MSELSYVKVGQSVGAHTINGLIDAVGGPSIPTEDGFVKTSQGSIFKKSYNLGSNSRSFQSEFLDVKLSEAPKDLSCGYKMIWMQMGRDLDCAKDRLDARHIYFYDKTTDQIKELEASDFDVNGEDLSYDGYVCTNISAIQPFKLKSGESEETVGDGDGYLYGVYIKHEDDAASTKYVITNDSNSSNVAEKVSASEDDVKRIEKIATATKDRDGFDIIKIPLPAKADVVPGDADVDFTKESLANAVQLSSIHRYDLSGNTWYQLHNFDKTDVSSYAELSSKNPALLVRTSETEDGKEKHILEYVSLSSMLSGSLTDTEYSEARADKQESIERRTDNDSTFLQLHKFDDRTYVEEYADVKDSHILIRDIDGDDKILKYLPLSSLSASGVNVDSETENANLSSIGSTQVDGKKVYELYGFDKMRTDINAHIMPVGTMLPGRFGKVGKLLDQNDNELTAVDIVARDKDTHKIKYLNFTVDETFADTDVGPVPQASLEFKQDATGLMTYAQLYDFQKRPTDTLSATIHNNGVVNITDNNTWVLTKTYNAANDRLELQYKHMSLSVDLSSIQSDSISGDTNVITTRKSIDTKQEGNVKYHQLHNFDNPNPTTKTVDMQNKNTAYDTLDSNEYYVIKSGDEIKYKKVQIKDNTPGGGSTEGLTIDLSVVVSSTYSEEYHTFTNKMKKLSFANGLLTAAIDLADQTVFTAVEHIAHD